MESKDTDRLKPISIPIRPDQALAAALRVDPDELKKREKDEKTKKKVAKKKSAKRKK